MGSRRPPPPEAVRPPLPPLRGTAPPPIRMPFGPPLEYPQRGQSGRGPQSGGRGGFIGPQQPRRPAFPQPMGVPGLLQRPGPVDSV
ncbi:MAG: hypothetical protein ACK56F_07220, partial [bacterium]